MLPYAYALQVGAPYTAFHSGIRGLWYAGTDTGTQLHGAAFGAPADMDTHEHTEAHGSPDCYFSGPTFITFTDSPLAHENRAADGGAYGHGANGPL